ncbi:hypothetical protein OHA77_40755 [Streptosporangium sp. NBC_01639]|uniref:hypothetical protein n=1 Tax=unclassified Streptosporangium TaxID=2632669 RepID=UPI002DDB9F23|nr:hypothetical protein [Streptosporangium sp. NBC_01756]WSC86572.1 hypothetical protein OIE48_40570 [Streptosporangium sp. NBC_01756]WTD54854.1 hypothetical protein OHA77_40755 [Streptosporangium sp. NBC_01639]
MNVLGKLGDHLLEKLVPKATAKADASYWQTCACYGTTRYAKLCYVVGGISGCADGCVKHGSC